MDIFFDCTISGVNFDPIPFLGFPQFKILEEHCSGDLAKNGRLKGEILDFGYICFSSKDKDFDKFVKGLYQIKGLFNRSEYELFVVRLVLGYQNQCNWEFSSDTLKYMSELNSTLAISCYQEDDDYSSKLDT